LQPSEYDFEHLIEREMEIKKINANPYTTPSEWKAG
jgi:hypothetical protein